MLRWQFQSDGISNYYIWFGLSNAEYVLSMHYSYSMLLYLVQLMISVHDFARNLGFPTVVIIHPGYAKITMQKWNKAKRR